MITLSKKVMAFVSGGEACLCYVCAHYHSKPRWKGETCDAFPKGIPDALLYLEWHLKPYPGDNGIMFEERIAEVEKFDPDEPRDEKGRWSRAAAERHDSVFVSPGVVKNGVRQKFAPEGIQLTVEGRESFLEAMYTTRAQIKEETGQEIWYSSRYAEIVGVDAKEQGKGDGSKLLNRICAIADKMDITLIGSPLGKGRMSNEDLISWYGRHDFHKLVGTGNDIIMGRAPQSRKDEVFEAKHPRGAHGEFGGGDMPSPPPAPPEQYSAGPRPPKEDKEALQLWEQDSARINKELGDIREGIFRRQLEKKYPKEDGYEIHAQIILLDNLGRQLIDSKTKEFRKIDFVVMKDNKIIKSYEVTSESKNKNAQMGKEERIKKARQETGGKLYARIRGKEDLVVFPYKVKTVVKRIDLQKYFKKRLKYAD